MKKDSHVDPTPSPDMVLIPGGEFSMGSNRPEARAPEKPEHVVFVDSFYMDKHQVTNAEYAAFLNAEAIEVEGGITRYNHSTWYLPDEFYPPQRTRIGRAHREYFVKPGYESHPVWGVSWYGAMAYAEWAGKRLPTEAEWEKAARGNSPLAPFLQYPWGDNIDSSLANYDNHIGDTTAVGSYPANDYGLYDMVGNVEEWCLDQWDEDFYSIPRKDNPLSGSPTIQLILDHYTEFKSARVLRGGHWFQAADLVRITHRRSAEPDKVGTPGAGFRCVMSVNTHERTNVKLPGALPAPEDGA